VPRRFWHVGPMARSVRDVALAYSLLAGNGLPIGVQLVSGWLAESTVLHLASLLEAASSVRDLHPKI